VGAIKISFENSTKGDDHFGAELIFSARRKEKKKIVQRDLIEQVPISHLFSQLCCKSLRQHLLPEYAM
jgi:hypothetical protein